MSGQSSFRRKVAYLIGIAVLMVPIALLGQPSTRGSADQPGSTGGVLSQWRNEEGLSQANLGELDPTTEALKLAALGMRGVASTILWQRSQNYQREQDWTALSAVNEQITKLQPHFVAAWRNQAWNLAYNVSIEWDNYKDRYFWIKKGIDFAKEGVRYNDRSPLMMWETGWIISQKIGRADEHRLFRELFREDDDFHGGRRTGDQRDNWLVGKEWYLAAQDLVDNQNVPLRGKSPVVFHTHPAMGQINYATAIEEEGTFGEVAQLAWTRAQQEWKEYGEREFDMYGTKIRFEDFDLYLKLYREKAAAIEALYPGLREQVAKAKMDNLSDADKALIEKDRSTLTQDDIDRLRKLSNDLQVQLPEVAENMPVENREEARELASEAMNYYNKIELIDTSRNQVNYRYWKVRCEAERTDDALAAHRLLYEGDQAYNEGADLQTAREKYEAGLQHWRNVFDQFPVLIQDTITGDELLAVINRYKEILRKSDEPFPDPFVLQDLLDFNYMPSPPANPAAG